MYIYIYIYISNFKFKFLLNDRVTHEYYDCANREI